MVGITISHYKAILKIGQGGMGEVYRHEDTNLSHEMAIKVPPEQFTQDLQPVSLEEVAASACGYYRASVVSDAAAVPERSARALRASSTGFASRGSAGSDDFEAGLKM